ncbi:MAG: protein kinase [Planctomycetales bacterium]|nr:protein kinase [Planctomycetales bacterium]
MQKPADHQSVPEPLASRTTLLRSSPDAGRPASESSKIEHAMELYLEHLESGSPVDRQDFLAKFPDIAEELDGQLEALEFLHVTAPQLSEAATGTADDQLAEPTTLGDFRLRRPIGRGGMGIVYEAEQLSLGRRVAVKVLPFAAMLDTKQLKRFQNEARSAAMLEHSHIVPIYFVGRERGVHFYAMQFIEGRSLAEIIHELRAARDGNATRSSESCHGDSQILSHPSQANSSASRREFYASVAKLGAQAAEALQHAHEQRIIHRDVKPGNLLVDWAGKLWVTDFGLARLENHESMTAEADILGTLAYMSPEQLNSPMAIDFRTDIYSLGATLYELLTQERPFYRPLPADGKIISARAEIPPLRRIDRQVPLDLQTIVLKAMEHDPRERYGSAAEMAQDLLRFAAGASIRARPPSPLEQLTRWTRRHPRMVMLSSLASLILLFIMAVSTLLVWQANSKAQAALLATKNHSDQIEHLLYLSDMERAYKAWESRRLEQVQKILQEQIPQGGEADLRHSEWFILNRLSQPVQPRLLAQHDGPAYQVAVFPDAARVASVGEDKQLRISDINTRKSLACLSAGDSSVEAMFSVSISPDGNYVATGSDVVLLWDSQSWPAPQLLSRFDYNVQSLTFTPDGQRVAAASRYDRVRILDLSGNQLHELQDGARHESLEFSTDGQKLVVPCRNPQDEHAIGVIRVYQADFSQVHLELRVQDANLFPEYTLANLSPDGSFLLVSSRYGVESTRLLDAHTGAELLRMPNKRDEINATAISPDGSIFATAYNDGSIDYWLLNRLPDGGFIKPDKTYTLPAHRGKVHSIKFAGNDQLISCGADGRVLAWPLEVDKNPTRLAGTSAGAIETLPDGSLLVANIHGLELLREDGSLKLRYGIDSAIEGDCAVSPDGALIVGASNDKQIVVVNLAEDGVVQILDLDQRPTDLCFTNAGEQLAAVTSGGKLSVWDLPGLTRIAELDLLEKATGAHTCCRFSQDGAFLLASGDSVELTIVDTKTWRIVRHVPQDSAIIDIVFDREGKTLATAHADGAIRIWEWPSLFCQHVLVGHDSGLTSLAFSPDGHTLVSSSADGTTRIWAPKTGRYFGILCSHPTLPYGLAFSQDGQNLFVGRKQAHEDHNIGILVFGCHE